MNKTSRRKFIKKIIVIPSIMIVPRHVLGGEGFTAPSDKLNIVGVGVSGRGRSNINACNQENIVALCDVDHSHAAKTFKQYPKATVYKDYKVMLEILDQLDNKEHKVYKVQLD